MKLTSHTSDSNSFRWQDTPLFPRATLFNATSFTPVRHITPNIYTHAHNFVVIALPETGQVTTANDVINSVQHITRYASLSNFVNIPTDCPQRERRGWMGDAQLSAETTIHNWDMGQGILSPSMMCSIKCIFYAAYTKFLLDIQDAQSFANKNGQLPDCVPYYGHGSLPSDPAWGTAYTLIYNWFYRYFGDTRILQQHYSTVKLVSIFRLSPTHHQHSNL